MVLHWLIALVIFLLLPMGWWMTRAIADPATQALAYRLFQVHKALGFLILALTIIRIIWRLVVRPPHPLIGMGRLEVFAARAVQYGFYGLLLALPLSGWVYISTGWTVSQDQPLNVATNWFGLFSIPHIEAVQALAQDSRRTLAFSAAGAHAFLAWGAVALVALHVGAALKHHFINRDSVLVSILPWGTVTVSPAETRDREATWPALLTGLGVVVSLLTAGAIAQAPSQRVAKTQKLPVALVGGAEAPVAAGTATQWSVDTSASIISFSGKHAGNAFTGQFKDWNAQIWFDPVDLAGSRASVDIKTGSARTGDPTQEGSLQGAEWFDPTRHPTARFAASKFRHIRDDRYEAVGLLRVKAVEVPVVLRFTFNQRNGVAAVTGNVSLDRTALDLGLISDAAGAWVSKDIVVAIDLKAIKAGPSRPAH